MPQLAESNIEEIKLPSSETDPVIVVVDLTANGGMAEDVYGSDGRPSKPVSGILANAIKSWNLTKPDGSPEPITQENVRRLDPTDFGYLAGKLFDKLDVSVKTQPISTDEKKG